ncbi:OadG family transporter subunit [Sediminispirochaeta smaragdinae]|uniref:Sodium pump decarboxylase gamma subunit n=1 Tax=Sediminispirochaeta smaragdinae (strain DSM 11293 / JCM 15392 / SEBR 4228) TaxID=573413 RepID=E1R9D1_SEDSS|nr:OadG family transporter subunit [Sediminispirochaeta smaragdinae]ADK83100.1 sodium pump decarboxylase gamma subunit [Sediminispirochaeta smaragdinae DSM 11293]
MIGQGLTLMVVGMAVVFILLVLLVYVMKLLSFVVNRFFPDKEEEVQPKTQRAGEADILAAIASAAAYHNS